MSDWSEEVADFLVGGAAATALVQLYRRGGWDAIWDWAGLFVGTVAASAIIVLAVVVLLALSWHIGKWWLDL